MSKSAYTQAVSFERPALEEIGRRARASALAHLQG